MEHSLGDKIFFGCVALFLGAGLVYSVREEYNSRPILGKTPPPQYRKYDFNKNGVLDSNEIAAILRDEAIEAQKRADDAVIYIPPQPIYNP